MDETKVKVLDIKIKMTKSEIKVPPLRISSTDAEFFLLTFASRINVSIKS